MSKYSNVQFKSDPALKVTTVHAKEFFLVFSAPIHETASKYAYSEKMTGAPILWVATIPYIMINTYKTAQVIEKIIITAGDILLNSY